MPKLRGNIQSLARLVVILLCVIVAAALSYLLAAPASVVVGSVSGAAVSLLVNWLVGELENPGPRGIPEEFVAAAKSDISDTGYYRRNQEIMISAVRTQDDSTEYLDLVFTAEIIPTSAKAGRISYPRITPCVGLERVPEAESYRVGETLVTPGMAIPITKKTRDILIVRYRLTDYAKADISDIHRWPSPVLNYTVKTRGPNGYKFHIGKIVSGREADALSPARGVTTDETIFSSESSAFTAQGIEWRIQRNSNCFSI